MIINVDKNNDYFLFQKGSSNKLIIAFSAATVPKGKFSFNNIFRKSKDHILYLNCPDNSWYLSDINGIKAEVFYTDLIQNIILEENISETIFFGGSMGAYGAIYYGALLNADKIYAMGVEIELFDEDSNSSKYFKKKVSRTIPDINKVLSESSFKVAYVLYGERCINDLYQSSLIKPDKRITKIPLRELTHSIPPSLQSEFIIIDALNNSCFIDLVEKKFKIGDSNIESNLFHIEILLDLKRQTDKRKIKERTLRLAEIALFNTNSKSLKSLLKSYIIISSTIIECNKTFSKHITLEMTDATPESIPHIIRHISNSDLNNSYELGKEYLHTHKPKLLDPNINLLYELGCISYKVKDYILALSLLEEFCSRRPNHDHAKNVLSLCKANK